MKERRSLYSNFGPNEALIKEYQALFDKISIHKGSKYSVIEQLKKYKLLINENLITAKKLVNKSWRIDYKKIEDEVAGYLLSTFKFDYLHIEFTSTIPNKIESANDSEFENKLNDPNKIPISILLQFTNIPEINTLNKIAGERLKLIEKVIDCLDNGGLLESEINKRSPFTFLRYHVHFTVGVDEKKKSKKPSENPYRAKKVLINRRFELSKT